MTKETQYQVFMLRVWRDGEDKAATRFSIEDTKTGERLGFATLDELVEYLRKQFG